MSGASGFLGRALCAHLAAEGHRVVRFVRARAGGYAGAGPASLPVSPASGAIAWDPAHGVLDHGALVGLDAVVNLAGAGLADKPWTRERKRELIESRVRSTESLATALARARGSAGPDRGPGVFVSASAVGWYGERGDESLSESSTPGTGFLAGLVREWEGAADAARRAGLRVVHPRMGLVLSPREGVLRRLEVPFRLGAGGPLGSGRAWWSWITLNDLLRVFDLALADEALAGAVNAVSPQPVRQRELARALGRALGRPAVLPAPAFALRALLGRELVDEMLLASQRVLPAALLAAGFVFEDPELAPALERMYRATRRAGVR